MDSSAIDQVKADTQVWLERAVIGLNLCPFAKAPHVKGRIHYAVSKAQDAQEVRQDLSLELQALMQVDPAVRETTLLILPLCLSDFYAFNDFLDVADRLVRSAKLEGVIQIASFHPRYQFAGTDPDEVSNCTNRSPYPMLHLLREDSVERAVAAYPEAKIIVEANMQALEKLGWQGWQALDVGPKIKTPHG